MELTMFLAPTYDIVFNILQTTYFHIIRWALFSKKNSLACFGIVSHISLQTMYKLTIIKLIKPHTYMLLFCFLEQGSFKRQVFKPTSAFCGGGKYRA